MEHNKYFAGSEASKGPNQRKVRLGNVPYFEPNDTVTIHSGVWKKHCGCHSDGQKLARIEADGRHIRMIWISFFFI